jgi:hypothetical protein
LRSLSSQRYPSPAPRRYRTLPSRRARFGEHDVATVCQRGFAESVRHPYDTDWRRFRVEVFRAHGIAHDAWSSYTVDHLVPLELDGAPLDLRNVWPEPKAGAAEKDAVESALHEAVCYRRTLTLEQTQAAIARDWARTPVGVQSR